MTCTEERFLNDVAKHQMTVMMDHGVYRHLRFASPKCSINWFEIVTWPGCLAIQGDCGCFVFSRLTDMLEFFRRGDEGKTIHINPQYWAEKLQAQECNGKHSYSVKEWCQSDFEQRILERYVDHIRRFMNGMPCERRELRCELEENVISKSGDQREAIQAALGFNLHGLNFEDFWEADCTEWSHRFIWNLYAIVWGIQQYDASQAEKAAA